MTISLARNTTVLKAFTGNAAAQELKREDGTSFQAGDALDAGGIINFGTATTAKVKVYDSYGRILHSDSTAIVASTQVNPSAAGVKLPLYATVTEISNASHTLTVVWSLRK